ncbi:heterokaryon incompatibility protein-domain-containing protein [Lasiosphaeris hirsuta]|uniref:Heterokaryon incompatibility protein-domain-containing protein n=1 Tax=Lasiosphaeris hirsuta TaxID=260670 RepID=A0AA40E7R8_9PEZI|nr:heterokaryon incompatibility protein-domain-containing protein [Lasiosphaeris hirsuta]
MPDSMPDFHGSAARQLCSVCETLDLEAMFCDEVKEKAMGQLADYDNPECPFCALISQSIRSAWGKKWSASRLCTTASTPPRLFMQSRSPLSARRNGRIEHPQPRLLLAIDQKPPGFHRDRAMLKEVDRVKDRFIIAEIEALPSTSAPFMSALREADLLPRRKVGDGVNIPLLRHWLDECKKHKHSEISLTQEAEGSLQKHQHPFRLIDVLHERLVHKTERCDYAALSYVWGRLPTILNRGGDKAEVPILLTTRDNLKSLCTSRSLSQSRPGARRTGGIPHTIRDAMDLTRRIGMRYLWVDTLCIVQDDPRDKQQLIGIMDDVYNNAVFTIVAASGDDAKSGLRGVSPRTGRPVSAARIKICSSDDTTLDLSMCLPSLCEEVRRSAWNTRGWTFQEQCLSRRCLYFAQDEVFFNCSEAQWREGYDYGERCESLPGSTFHDVQVRTGPPWWSRNLRRDLDPTPYRYLGRLSSGLDVHGYQRAVQEYSRRELTFPHDVLSAFEGTFKQFANAREDNVRTTGLSIRQAQGIPSHLLYQAVLWFPSNEAQRRRCTHDASGAPTEEFPTWSRASYFGAIDFVFADNLWISRNISQAPTKPVPFYGLVTSWHYEGGTQDTHNQLESLRARRYLVDYFGLDVDLLLPRSQLEKEAPSHLACGELGFLGACLLPDGFRISRGTRVAALELAGIHRGEFRFDNESEANVDQLVAVAACDTIIKPPGRVAIFVGLATEEGVSRRVGVGFVYLDQGESSMKPQWEYRFWAASQRHEPPSGAP